MSDSQVDLEASKRAGMIATQQTAMQSDAALAAIIQITGGDVNAIANVLSIAVAKMLSGTLTKGVKHVNEVLWLHDTKRRQEIMENHKPGAIVVTSAMPSPGAAEAILGKKKNGKR